MKRIKLIATDMDHTLLTEKGAFPPDFDEVIEDLARAKIKLAIASGRPLYTLEKSFANKRDKIIFIADNGGIISLNGQVIFKSLLNPPTVQELLNFTKENTSAIAILCALDNAYISSENKKYEHFLKKFYTKISLVNNLKDYINNVDKFTIYFPKKDSQDFYEKLFKPKYQTLLSVTVGDTVWIDLMNLGINKGGALKILGKHLQIDSQEMMAFGDTYNDIEMLKSVDYSYIVANASPEMSQYAKFIAPANDEFGVTQIIRKVVLHKNER